ncbi:MAG: folate-binding protein YgfZ, partial [Methylococcaceae bacterium]|nr:folate-binding protein YgfZ [Methylococcaceae bacterium]
MTDSMHAAAWFAELPHLGVLEIGGADAAKFLQGQATCDVLALNDETSSLGAFCTAQGRVLAVFRILRGADRFQLVMPRELIEPVARRLRMYVLRSAVTLNDVSAAWICLGLRCAPADDRAWLGLSRRGQVVRQEGRAVLDWPSVGSARALVLVPGQGLDSMREQLLAHGLMAADEAVWQLDDIRAGIPSVSSATSEEFIPQMLNLDLLGGIGFKKG